MSFRLVYLHSTLAHTKGQDHHHVSFDCEYPANGDRYGRHCYWKQIESHIWAFDYHIYIWPWPILMVKVKVIHTWTMNISKKVTDRVNTTIAIKYEVEYGLSISVFRFDLRLFKGQLGSWNGMLPNILAFWLWLSRKLYRCQICYWHPMAGRKSSTYISKVRPRTCNKMF